MILNENVDKKIIPIAGGKGGVGKSIISVNLSLALAQQQKKILLIDLDLGGSNCHTLLGFRNNNKGIGNFLMNNKVQLEDLIVGTPYDNLSFIPGDAQVFGTSTLTLTQVKRILKNLPELEYDYILLDLGAGASLTTLDFFLVSNSGILVSTPINTSISNAHIFLKNLVFRFLQRAFDDNKQIYKYLKRLLKENRPGHFKKMEEILSDIAEIDKDQSDKAEAFLNVLQPKIILNMIRDPEEYQIGASLSELAERDFFVNLECLGMIVFEDLFNTSIQLREPFILKYPDSLAAKEIHRIAEKIAHSVHYPEMPFDYEYYKDSFELAFLEAEYDFEELQKEFEDLKLPDGSYDIEKMLNIIEMQRKRIEELENSISS